MASSPNPVAPFSLCSSDLDSQDRREEGQQPPQEMARAEATAETQRIQFLIQPVYNVTLKKVPLSMYLGPKAEN